MSIPTFFKIISFFLLLILIAVTLQPQADASEPCHNCPMLDAQQEQIDSYGKYWETLEKWNDNKKWYQDWARFISVEKQIREAEALYQQELLEVGKRNVDYYTPYIMEVWIQKDDFWIIAKLTLVPLQSDMPIGCEMATGCYIHKTDEIVIIKGKEGYSSKLGCSVLWHEILHGKGLDHGAMKQKYDNWVCAVK